MLITKIEYPEAYILKMKTSMCLVLQSYCCTDFCSLTKYSSGFTQANAHTCVYRDVVFVSDMVLLCNLAWLITCPLCLSLRGLW